MGSTTSKYKVIILRGFIEQINEDKWRAICLNLNLPVEGRSLKEVEQKLDDVTRAYLIDALQEGDLDAMYPRHAPLSYYLRYYWLVLRSLFLRPTAWRLFSDPVHPPLNA